MMEDVSENGEITSTRTIGPVNSLGDFIDVSSKLIRKSALRQTTGGLWWRGQSDATWPLIPTLYRSTINSEYERELIRDFRLKSLPFLGQHIPSKAIEWLFLMQHHGAPTRILDWTESPLVALYFCVVNFEREKDGAVWVLHPWVMNWIISDLRLAPTIDAPIIGNYVVDHNDLDVPRTPTAEFPLAVRMQYGFNRAHSQRGTATIHGFRRRSIESLKRLPRRANMSKTQESRFLTKIIIDGTKKFDVLKSLYEFGIGADTLFPDLDGLSKALCVRYDHRYLGTKLRQT